MYEASQLNRTAAASRNVVILNVTLKKKYIFLKQIPGVENKINFIFPQTSHDNDFFVHSLQAQRNVSQEDEYVLGAHVMV